MSAEYNIVLAGRYGVGKTSIFKRLRHGKVPDPNLSTTDEDVGVDMLRYERRIKNKNIRVTLWDTGGHERHDSLTGNYYRNAHGVILVYALDDESSLYALDEWVGDAKEMNRQGECLVLALWGTKADLPSSQRTVKDEAADALRENFSIPPALNCKVSVYDESVETAMLTVVQHLDDRFSGDGTDISLDTPTATLLHTTTTRNGRCC